jgi:hypothetical protein
MASGLRCFGADRCSAAAADAPRVARSARLARARRQGSRADAESSEAGAWCRCAKRTGRRSAARAPDGADALRCRRRRRRPQEKKKKPKGRAYKRLQVRRLARRPPSPNPEIAAAAPRLTPPPARAAQYNRRFVNVVVGLGKKKGPNSNTV